MTSPIADGVLAATHRLVQQAMSGQWQEVPKTVEERRVLLDKLSAGASPQDQQWLSALKQAMAESDAVVASLTPGSERAQGSGLGPEVAAPLSTAQDSAVSVDSMLDMIRGSKL
jgi:hypothetical protein